MALFLICLFVSVLIARYLWMSYLAHGWMTACILYVAARGKEWTPEEKIFKILDFSAVWPMSQMMSRFWVWDFSRFIVNLDAAKEVLDFYAKRDNIQINR